MTRLAFIMAAVLFVSAGPALAQTAPLNPGTLIAQHESSGCTNNYSSSSTASGCFGFLNGTWAEYAPQAGISLSQYPTAASAPVSDQFAVFAAAYNQNGFSDWTCSGCDPAATAAIQAAGGPSAFAAPGTLSTDPQSYAALDTSAGLQAYLAGNGVTTTAASSGTSPLSFTDPSSGVVPTGSIGSVTPAGSAFGPFCLTWNYYQTGIVTGLNSAIGTVETMAAGPLSALLVLMVIVTGVMTLTGQYSIIEYRNRILRMAFVVAFIGAAGSALYSTYVTGFFLTGLPNWEAQVLNPGGGATMCSSFDGVFFAAYNHAAGAWHNVPGGTGIASLVFDAIVLGLALVVIWGTEAIMFAVFIVLQALLAIAVCLGPVIILAVLFDYLRGVFDRWIGVLITLSLGTLAVGIVVNLVMSLVTQTFNRLQTGTTADILILACVSMVVAVLAGAVALLPVVVDRIGGGAGVPHMHYAHRWLTQNVYNRAGQAAQQTPTALGRFFRR